LSTPSSALAGSASPGAPLPEINFLYILYYRTGNNPHAMVKHFKFNGDLRGAMDRARRHCETTNLRFVRVEPFLHTLDEEEKIYLKGDER
jgi:hypothetical protein